MAKTSTYAALFEEAHLHLARASDPTTSKQAAKEIAPRLSDMEAAVLEMVRQTPRLTCQELASEHGVSDVQKVSKRMKGLEKAGKVVRGEARRCKVTNKMAACWTVA